MKISLFAVYIFTLSYGEVANAFRTTPDGDPKVMQKVVEDAIFPKVTLPADPPIRNQILGTEEQCKCEYWSRSDIHTLGNVGFGGAVHAAMAPFATKMIDMKAYGGKDVRKMISQELHCQVKTAGARVMDLCCGVGMSTRALGNAFHDAEYVVGIDTSPEMISMAEAITNHDIGVENVLSRHRDSISEFLQGGFFSFTNLGPLTEGKMPGRPYMSYRLGNAEDTKFPSVSFDLVTIMYGFHEIPMEGRSRIIQEAWRLLRQGGSLAILDICPTYQPSKYMLAGEPFVLEYQQNIDKQLEDFPGYNSRRKVVVPGHVNLWLLTKKEE